MKRSVIKKIVHRVGAYPLLVGVAFVVFGCASAIPHLSSVEKASVPAEWASVDLEHGRTCYIRSCGACHSLHSPAEHTPAEWKTLFAEMAGKANLSPTDSTSILAYLTVASKPLAAH